MSDCLIYGDSIAVGVAQHLACESRAAVGRTTPNHITSYYDVTVVSLGSNDAAPPLHLWEVRAGIPGRVVWLLPPRRHRELVLQIAARYGDNVVDVADERRPDGVHPTPRGYRNLAQRVRNFL